MDGIPRSPQYTLQDATAPSSPASGDAPPAWRGLVPADNLCEWWGTPPWRRARGHTAARLRGCWGTASQAPRGGAEAGSQMFHGPSGTAPPHCAAKSLAWLLEASTTCFITLKQTVTQMPRSPRSMSRRSLFSSINYWACDFTFK